MPQRYLPISTMIMTALPDFCWQTAMEVVTMLEQIDEDVSVGSVLGTLHRLAKEGRIEFEDRGVLASRKGRAGRPRGFWMARHYRAKAAPRQ